jgi:hypothetical protein
LRERFFGTGRRGVYATNQQHFATAPLPPIPPYAVSNGNNVTFRDIYEHRAMPYVTAAAAIGSEYFSEEDNG